MSKVDGQCPASTDLVAAPQHQGGVAERKAVMDIDCQHEQPIRWQAELLSKKTCEVETPDKLRAAFGVPDYANNVAYADR